MVISASRSTLVLVCFAELFLLRFCGAMIYVDVWFRGMKHWTKMEIKLDDKATVDDVKRACEGKQPLRRSKFFLELHLSGTDSWERVKYDATLEECIKLDHSFHGPLVMRVTPNL